MLLDFDARGHGFKSKLSKKVGYKIVYFSTNREGNRKEKCWQCSRNVPSDIKFIRVSLCNIFRFKDSEKKLRDEGIDKAVGLKRFEFVGNEYEAGRADIYDYEFDVQVILSGGSQLDLYHNPLRSGFHYLKPKKGKTNSFLKITNATDEYISSHHTNNIFADRLDRIVNASKKCESELNRYDIEITKHGPASQLDLSDYNGEYIYAVDMVPTFEIGGNGKQYLPNRCRNPDTNSPVANTWRISYSV